MFVKNIMIPKHECIIAQADETLNDALDRLEKLQIDGLSVLNGDKYVGVITRFNIYEGFFIRVNKRMII